MAIRNILNRNNPGPIIGNIGSPLFGQANQPYGINTLGGTGFSEAANNRRLDRVTDALDFLIQGAVTLAATNRHRE